MYHLMQVLTWLSLNLRRVSAGDRGAVAVEYAFLAAFIAVAAAIGMLAMGPEMLEFFADTGTAVLNAGSGNFTNDPIGAYTPS